ncbi:MAG: hypothetical protein QM487_14270, partial [Candidatus Marithrix sp.]
QSGFDIQEGTITYTHPSSGVNSITAMANGWYRITMVHPSTGSNNRIYRISLSDTEITSNTLPTYSGDGTSGIYIYGANLTNTAYTAPLNITPAITTVTDDAFTDAVYTGDSESGCLMVEMKYFVDNGVNKMISIHTGSGDEYITIRTTSVGEIECLYWNGSSVVGKIEWTDGTLTDFNKIVYRWKDNEFTMFANGSQIGQVTSGTIIDIFTEIALERGNGASYFYGGLKQFIKSEYLSDTKCINLSTQ